MGLAGESGKREDLGRNDSSPKFVKVDLEIVSGPDLAPALDARRPLLDIEGNSPMLSRLIQSSLPSRARLVSYIAIAWVLGGFGTASTVSASRIRSSTIVSTPYGRMPVSFINFLNASPNVWARVNPNVPAHLTLSLDSNGQLPSSPFVDYLQWRRGLNQARFDRYHHRLSSLLDVAPQAVVSASFPNHAILPPPRVPYSIEDSPRRVIPPLIPPNPQTVVPEPSSWLVGACLVGTVAFARRRRGASRL